MYGNRKGGKKAVVINTLEICIQWLSFFTGKNYVNMMTAVRLPLEIILLL